MQELADTLRSGNYSCVIRNGGVTRTFVRRGVTDLFALLKTEPEFLNGAAVADKVVGKGAAALMALGGIRELYAGVISTPARELLQKEGFRVSFGREVPAIRNREDTGFCPLETLCRQEESPTGMLILIENFINSHTAK